MSKKVEISDMNEDASISEEDLKHVKGGLLPATPMTAGPVSRIPKISVPVDPKISASVDNSSI